MAGSEPRPKQDRPRDTATEFDFELVARQLRRARKRLKKSQPNVNKLSSSIESISYEDTIDGSSTLTVLIADPDATLWHFFDIDKDGKIDRIDVNYPEGSAQWWRMTQFGANTDAGYIQLELTFMERPAVLLQRLHGPKKASRGKLTRAEFFKRLVDEAAEKSNHPMKLYSFELHQKQPIYGTGSVSNSDRAVMNRMLALDPPGIAGAMPPVEPPTADPVPDSEPNSDTPKNKPDKTRRERKEGGIPADADLTVRGLPAKREQKKQMERALDVAFGMNAPKDAVICMLCTGLAESGFKAVMNLGGSDYGGVFQGDVAGGTFALDDTEAQAKCFLRGGKGFQGGGAINLTRQQKSWSTGKICFTIQGNRSNFSSDQEATSFFEDYPINSHNGKFLDEAEAIFDAYGGDFSGGPVYRRSQYNFQIGTDSDPYESYWDGMQRLAEEVRWRLFINGKIVYFDDDMRLIKQKPVLILHRDSERIVSWSATWDARKMATEMTMDLVAAPFEFRAGDVFWLKEFGPLGRASSAKPQPLPGRWLVTDVSRSSGTYASSITLSQPKRPYKEPAAEVLKLDKEDIASTGGGLDDIDKGMSPKDIIDELVCPLARKHDMVTGKTPAMVAAANAVHGPTVSGGTSDHQGPPDRAWAADMSNGTSPTPQMDALAKELARKFDLSTSSWNWRATAGPNSNHIEATHGSFRYQMIYRNDFGGNHYNHVHFGVARA